MAVRFISKEALRKPFATKAAAATVATASLHHFLAAMLRVSAGQMMLMLMAASQRANFAVWIYI